MQIFFLKVFSLIEKGGWKISFAVLSVLFVAGWIVLALFEPVGSAIVSPEVYWWWFIVTTTTVGYGDFSPVSLAGRIAAMVIMIGGISAIGIIITQMAQIGSGIRRKMVEGTLALRQEGHVVILGYHPGKTERLVNELNCEAGGLCLPIVLCFTAEQSTENPIPSLVEGAKGPLSSRDLLERACVDKASRIVVDGESDESTVIIALSVCEMSRNAHIVAAVTRVEETRDHLMKVRPDIECVPKDIVSMIAEATQDPGITRMYNRFMSNLEGRNSAYRYDIPEDRAPQAYGELLLRLKQSYDSTLLAVASINDYQAEIVENPPWDHEVRGGMAIYYVGPSRITNLEKAWDFKT